MQSYSDQFVITVISVLCLKVFAYICYNSLSSIQGLVIIYGDSY